MSLTPQDDLARADRELLDAYERVLADLGAGHPSVLPGDEAAIVRSLAEVPEGKLLRGAGTCALCGAGIRCCSAHIAQVRDSGLSLPAHLREVHGHDPSCPWALARAWVAAHDGPSLPSDLPDGGCPDEDYDPEPPQYDDGPDDPADRVRR